MRNSIEKGHPVNSPIWWVSPYDPNAQKEDTGSDEAYLLAVGH